MPPGGSEAQVAYYFITELGIWPYATAFMDLPGDVGAELFDLLKNEVPHRLAVMQEIAGLLKMLLTRG